MALIQSLFYEIKLIHSRPRHEFRTFQMLHGSHCTAETETCNVVHFGVQSFESDISYKKLKHQITWWHSLKSIGTDSGNRTSQGGYSVNWRNHSTSADMPIWDTVILSLSLSKTPVLVNIFPTSRTVSYFGSTHICIDVSKVEWSPTLPYNFPLQVGFYESFLSVQVALGNKLIDGIIPQFTPKRAGILQNYRKYGLPQCDSFHFSAVSFYLASAWIPKLRSN